MFELKVCVGFQELTPAWTLIFEVESKHVEMNVSLVNALKNAGIHQHYLTLFGLPTFAKEVGISGSFAWSVTLNFCHPYTAFVFGVPVSETSGEESSGPSAVSRNGPEKDQEEYG